MKDFRTSEIVRGRVEKFMDRFARKAWEPFYKNEKGFSKNAPAHDRFVDGKGDTFTSAWEVLDKSSGLFRSTLVRNADLLPKGPAHISPPFGCDIAENNSNWAPFEHDRIIEIISSDSVTSVADAMVKATAFLGAISKSMPYGKRRFLFRGQSNIKHELIPRLGRILKEKIKDGSFSPPADPLKVTDIELKDLESFQAAWNSLNKDEIDEFIVSKYTDDTSGWWVLMQHFADAHGNGTRMLDVTSSLHFALLFACVKWETGKVDTKTDGIVYLFNESGNFAVNDYLGETPPISVDFYTTTHDTPQLVFNPPHNERSKAQGGGFIWWPKFWEPLDSQIFYLRIPKDNKIQIARELLAFGTGPKEAVRGKKGLDNEAALRKIVDS